MMTMETMWRVVATVSDDWESDLAEEVLRRWESDRSRTKYWRASANFVFLFKRAGRDYVLRFNHESERTAEFVESELVFVNELIGRGVPAAEPIRSRNGSLVESVPTSHGTVHAAAFERVPGVQKDLEDLTPAELSAWGRALGELHNASAKSTGVGRPIWQQLFSAASRELSDEQSPMLEALESVRLQLEQLPVSRQNFGPIHFDFELDNIVWQDGVPRPIDFDDSCRSWFAADIAFALRDLFDDDARNVDLENESLLLFVDGYRSARPIESAELETIPLLLRMHHLIGLGRLKRTLTPPMPDEPEWMAELRSKLAATMETYRTILVEDW